MWPFAEIRLDPDIHRGTACAKNKIQRPLALFTVYAAYRPLINVATGRDRAFSSQFGRGRITVRFTKSCSGKLGWLWAKKTYSYCRCLPKHSIAATNSTAFKKNYLRYFFGCYIYIFIYIYSHLLFICGQNGRRNLTANSTPRRPNPLPSRIQESRTGYTPQVLSPTYVVDGPRVEHLKEYWTHRCAGKMASCLAKA